MLRTNKSNLFIFASFALAAVAATGCESGGVGDPCTPEDEFFDDFSGFSLGEVNVESRSFQCETRVCLVNKFQGRVSCPYGTNGTNPDPTAVPTVNHNLPCELPPPFEGNVSVAVLPQRADRRPEVSVYCSCRCDAKGDTTRAECECPSGYVCQTALGPEAPPSLAGGYCMRAPAMLAPVIE